MGLLHSGQTSVIPLKRLVALMAPVQASATVGLLGGSLSVPGTGLSVVIPPFAVSQPTTITVTAMPGTNVAYVFAPHGLTFGVPLVATQSLNGTQAQTGGGVSPLSLLVGYFPNAQDVSSVTELLSLNVNLFDQTSTVLISHFSGYVWSSGRGSDSTSSEGNEQ